MGQQPLERLLGRAVRLRCPRCGQDKLFDGLFRMKQRCTNCWFQYEREPGYFLGSTYINYGLTTALLTAGYVGFHFLGGYSNTVVVPPLAVFCVVFPLLFFRYARALWLAVDCHFDRSRLAEESSKTREHPSS